LDDMALGKAGKTIVIEDFVKGQEMTVLALTDGKTIRVLPSSQDHKRALDGDKGNNTGGMGAYSPVPWVDEAFMKEVTEKVLTCRGRHTLLRRHLCGDNGQRGRFSLGA
ncbi:MAG: hypothetical protein RR214_03970, partial [Synergistaceae bacterium]